MEANEILRSEHGEKLVHDAVERSWVNDEAQAAFRVQNPAGAVRRSVQNRLDSMEADKVLRTEHRKELVNNRAGNMMVNMAAKIRYQQMQEDDRQAEAAAQLKASMRAQEAEVNPVTGEVTYKSHKRRKKR